MASCGSTPDRIKVYLAFLAQAHRVERLSPKALNQAFQVLALTPYDKGLTNPPVLG
jgi:hypothetical protein